MEVEAITLDVMRIISEALEDPVKPYCNPPINRGSKKKIHESQFRAWERTSHMHNRLSKSAFSRPLHSVYLPACLCLSITCACRIS